VNVVFDTNVYISALAFPGGICDHIFRFARLKKFDLLVSPDILTELKVVFTKKFKYSEDEAENIVDRVLAVAGLIYPRFRIAEIEHPDADNRILECASECAADFLVSGDKRHILSLKRFGDTRIISPSQFVDLIPGMRG
jgi:putative PIN family toxin of toxin-antitoxin system